MGNFEWIEFAEEHYGENAYGKLHVENTPWSPLREYFFGAAAELGLSKKDFNGPQSVGVGTIERTQKKGKRWGTFFAFLKNILSRSNLTVSRYSQAIKVCVMK